MSEPLDLRHYRVALDDPSHYWQLSIGDVIDLLAEVDRLRAELARRDEVYERDQKFIRAQQDGLARRVEQIAAVRALHGRMVNNENVCDTCTTHQGLYQLWPCATLRALDGAS